MTKSDYIEVSYLITTEQDPIKIAKEIAFEQTVEMPPDLICDPQILEKIVGHVLELKNLANKEHYQATLAYSPEIITHSFSQLMNLLFGNISLKKGIKLIDLSLPSSFLNPIFGPSYGVKGLREKVGIPDRPLICTALKPLGLSACELADLCYQFSLGGIDIVKDDHNLGDHPFCKYQDRIRLCHQAILKAREKTGKKTLYFANINSNIAAFKSQIDYALELGIDGLLLQPSVIGLDFFHSLARDYPFLLMAHPSLTGVFFTSEQEGIVPEVLLGTIFRLAGADAVIFPHAHGRFSFDELTCQKVKHNLLAPLDNILTSFPTPAGGIEISTLSQAKEIYSKDTIFLIGADLYRTGQNFSDKIKYLLEILEIF